MNCRYNPDPDVARTLWESPLTMLNTSTRLGDIDNLPSPFFASIIQVKTVPNASIAASANNVIGRGYSHNKPIFRRFSHGFSGSLGDTPEAMPYDWVMLPMNGLNSPENMPQGGLIGDTDQSGFIGTSHQADVGLTRLVIAEIPTKPLQSLLELQHFDHAFYNPSPPYLANPIGNSNASYLIAPDAIQVDNGLPDSQQTYYDHSYIANHLLFDDWFVSSLASSSDTERQDSLDAFLSSSAPLPNRAFIPAQSELSVTLGSDTWRTFAEQIEVEGMFNVNSTSVDAWAALLKHLKGAQAPQINSATNTVSLDNGTGQDTPIGRTLTSGPSNEAVQIDQDIAQAASHTWMTDAQLEALAEEIVEQIQRRGPFLSLSEFMNRKLTSDASEEDLAVAGTIEAALAQLAKRPAEENPFAHLQALFSIDPDTEDVGFAHSFAKAKEGDALYGYPGWARQADLLRPLAPILSVRDDTFRIRAYGQAGESEAWCEAIVQRKAEYVDPSDSSLTPPSNSTLSALNQQLGRKFTILSFRWLTKDEI